jgi:hypothetical protein
MPTRSDAVTDVSIFRLYLLRAMYAFIAAGLAVTRWPEFLDRPADLSHMDTVVGSVLGAVSLLAVLGIRYPIRMLPLLVFELLWKSMWVLMWGLPRWSANELDSTTQQTLIACLMGIVLVPLVMPWGYVLDRFARAPGDPWRKPSAPIAPAQPAPSPAPIAPSSGP